MFINQENKREILFNSTGIENRHGVRTAGAARAIADLLYFMPKFYFDRPVDWGKSGTYRKNRLSFNQRTLCWCQKQVTSYIKPGFTGC